MGRIHCSLPQLLCHDALAHVPGLAAKSYVIRHEYNDSKLLINNHPIPTFSNYPAPVS